MNYLFHSQLPKNQGQPGAGAIPASQPAADADRSRPRIGLEHISIHDRYATDPACIRDDTQWNIAGLLKVRRSVKPKQPGKEEIRIEQTEN